MRANYGKPLRAWMKGQRIDALVDFGDLPVFETVTTYPCILVLRKETAQGTFRASVLKSLDFDDLAEAIDANAFTVNQTVLEDEGWALVDESAQRLLTKIRSVGVPLEEYIAGRIYRGVLTGLNEAFVIDGDTRDRLIAEDPKSAELIKPFLLGRDIKRYERPTATQHVIRIEKGWTNRTSGTVRNPWKWFRETYPAVAAHLAPFAERGEKRYDKGEYWWELRACDYYSEFEKPKLVYPNICKQPEFTFDESASFTNQKCFIIPTEDRFLLAVLNSRLCFFLFRMTLPKLRGDFYEPSYVYLKDFAIRTIDSHDPEEKAIHDKIVSLVSQRMEIGEKLKGAVTDHEVSRHEGRIQGIEDEIDRMVYELYGLTDEDVRIIERAD